MSYLVMEIWTGIWILIVLSILDITGILGGTWGISSPLDRYISFKLFEDGFNTAGTLLGFLIACGLLNIENKRHCKE